MSHHRPQAKIAILSEPDNAQAEGYLLALRRLPGLEITLIEGSPSRSKLRKALDFIGRYGLMGLIGFVLRRVGLKRRVARSGAWDAVHRVESLSGRKVAELLDAIRPDIGILVNAPIMPERVLMRFAREVLVAHSGLLPEYPGSRANDRALLDGVDPGVTVFGVRAGLDEGPVYARAEYTKPIKDHSSLHCWLQETSAKLMAETVAGLIDGTITGQDQPPRQERPFRNSDWTDEMTKRLKEAIEARNRRLRGR